MKETGLTFPAIRSGWAKEQGIEAEGLLSLNDFTANQGLELEFWLSQKPKVKK